MDRKELAVVLVLVALVLVAATVRIFWGPVGSPPEPRALAHPEHPRPRPHDSPQPVLAVSIWPPPPEHLLPRECEPRRLFEAAETAGAEGLFEAALEIYQHFLKKYPNEPACEIARLRLGQCATLAGRYREAAAYYEEFIRQYPKSAYVPLALLWSGESHIEIGEVELARRRLGEVVAHHSDSPFAKRAKARLEQLKAAETTKPPKTTSPR